MTLKDGQARAGDLVREATILVHAHDPASYSLKQLARVVNPVNNAAIALEQVGDRLEFACTSGEGNPTAWQQNEQILSALDEIRISGISARRHLLD